jgi:hypothetical protein
VTCSSKTRTLVETFSSRPCREALTALQSVAFQESVLAEEEKARTQAQKTPAPITRKRKASTVSTSSSLTSAKSLPAEDFQPAFQREPTPEDPEDYHNDTTRLLDAVLLEPDLRRFSETPLNTALEPQAPVRRRNNRSHNHENHPAPPAERSSRRQTPAQATNAEAVTSGAGARGTRGMDRAWSVVEDMMKKRHEGSGGEREEFLLVYCGK